METVENMYSAAVKAATKVALTYRLSPLNAEMVGVSAAEEAWAASLSAPTFDDMPMLAKESAAKMSRRERYDSLHWLRLADGFVEDDPRSVTVAINPEQEQTIDVRARLSDIQSAMLFMNEGDQSLLRYMLLGMSTLDIAKLVNRAVPLLVADLQRIRSELQASSLRNREARDGRASDGQRQETPILLLVLRQV